jgi:hypothetical protein
VRPDLVRSPDVPAKGLGASAANRGRRPSLPDPIPRICPTFARRYQPAASNWVRRHRLSEGFAFAVRGATCGDSNPDCHRPFWGP